MKPRDLVLAQLNHTETQPVPATLTCEPQVAAQLDSYLGDKRWRAALPGDIVVVRGVDAPVKKLNSHQYKDVYGTVWNSAGRPHHQERPGLEQPQLQGYQFPEPADFFDAGIRAKALRTCEAEQGKFLAAEIGWGLFELTWIIRGFENAMMDAIAEPRFFEQLLDHILELQIALVEASAELPVDAIMFTDDWGDQRGIILGPERWRRLLKPRLARLYQAARDKGKWVISHSCGNVTAVIPDAIEIGLDVLESVQPEAMDPYALKREWGKDLTFWGGLGSQSTLPLGSPQAIHSEVEKLCSQMGRGGGYVLAPAKGLQPGMPMENVLAVTEAFARQRGLTVPW